MTLIWRTWTVPTGCHHRHLHVIVPPAEFVATAFVLLGVLFSLAIVGESTDRLRLYIKPTFSFKGWGVFLSGKFCWRRDAADAAAASDGGSDQ